MKFPHLFTLLFAITILSCKNDNSKSEKIATPITTPETEQVFQNKDIN